MSANGSTLNSSFSSTSTVRPRNRRLVSYTDDPESDSAPSPFSSRTASPVPRTHLPRPENDGYSPSRQRSQRNGTPQKAVDRSFSMFSSNNSSPSAGLWETSWSSLQVLASSLLGSDSETSGNAPARGRPPMGVARWRQASESTKAPAPSSWGPKANTSLIAAGSQEERRALVQAKKREVLMRADADEVLDSKGRHKRRDSDGQVLSPTGQQMEEDALVYIHRVKPEDTLAGVMIRYGCQPAAFRKVNRFWPNDNIQIRKTVMIPIEACLARGKRIEPDLVDLLETDGGERLIASSGSTSGNTMSNHQTAPSDPEQGEPLWRHEYFVLIDGIPESIEVGRVTRRSLGFFPPSRRKSVSFSDLDSNPNGSRHTSFEFSRQANLLNSGSPSRSSTLPRRPSHRQRSSSTASQGNQHLMSRLRGPGGVGNLTGRTAIAPGPAPDSLNRIFAPHLPNVEPPDSLVFLVEDDDGVGSHTSRASSNTSGLENLGGAIEGWMRKMAGKVGATASGSGSVSHNRNSGNLGIGGWIPTGLGGDLIELGETPLDFQENEGTVILDGSPSGSLQFAPEFSRESTDLATPLTGRASSCSGFIPAGMGNGSISTSIDHDISLRGRGTQKGRTLYDEDDGKQKGD